MAPSTWAIISLLGLLGIIVIANVKNINVGLVGFGMAMLIGTVAGIPLKDMYSSFNTQIFLRLVSMQALIVIARSNGTLDILGNMAMKLTKGKLIRLLPIVLYFVMGISDWFSLGISGVMIPLIWLLAVQIGFDDPLALGFCTLFSLFSWGISPYSFQGPTLATSAAEQGFELSLWRTGITAALVGTVIFFAIYFYYGWHKMKPVELNDVSKKVQIGKDQILTLVAFAAFIVGNVVLKLDLMVVPIIASIVLICFGCAKPNEVVRGIPWTTLFMIGGMTVYVSVIKSLGGVELLVDILVTVSNKTIAPALMSGLCGVMSLFSSGNGVVIPTMTSTIASLTEAIPGLVGQTMFTAVMMGANATCISPMSTIGAQGLAYYAAAANPTEEQTKKVFNKLFIFAGCFLVWSVIAGLLGLYGILI